MIAFVCNTPVQVIRAIQMKLTIKEFYDDADIYINPCFNGAYELKKNLSRINCFRNVVLAIQPDINRAQALWYAYGMGSFQKLIRKCSYNKLISFNIEGALTDAIYNLNKNSKNFEFHNVEDAPAIYIIPKSVQYKHLVYKIFKFEKSAFNMTKWWTSCPELMRAPGIYNTVTEKLPSIDINNKNLVDVINKAFGYKDNGQLEKADLLIMDESFYQDKRIIDNADFKIYSEIREHYNKKNILVKMHPRTIHNRYEKNFKIYDSGGSPWEVNLMNKLCNSNKELPMISIACSTMTSDKLMFGTEGIKILMIPMFYNKVTKECAEFDISEERTKYFEKFKSGYNNPEKFQIVYSKEQLFNILEKIMKN